MFGPDGSGVDVVGIATAISDGGFASIRDKVERAARNDARLHLDAEQVRLLVRSPLWSLLARLAAEEFASRWSDEEKNSGSRATPASSSDPSGSTGAPSAASGQSPGTTPVTMDAAVESAERRRALAAVSGPTGGRPRRRRTP